MATIDVQVGASADDGYVYVTQTSVAPHTFTGIDITEALSLTGHSGLSRWGTPTRFTSVTIAQGSTIDVAYLTFTAYDTRTTTTVNTDIYGEDADNAATYSTVDDYNARPKTAVVVWDGIAAWTLNDAYNSPSLITPTQAIINRAGWASGNAMGWKWEDGDSSTGSAHRRAWTYNGSTTKAPKLHIEYTAGGVKRSFSVIVGA